MGPARVSVSNVIPFPISPPPAPRAVLQPSLHARGGRPYTFAGRIDEWHAPGVVVTKHGNTQCAVDAAWLVERVMGKPRNQPSMWPGVPGARERAIWAGQQVGIAAFQQEGAAFLAERDYALLYDQMGCVEGDAIIHVNRARRGRKMSLRDLYERFAGWDKSIETKVRVNAAGTLRQHAIVAVLSKGVRPVLCLTLKSGKSVRLTADHEVALANGQYARLDHLVVGDSVLSNGAAACKTCWTTKNVVTSRHAKFPGYCHRCIYRNQRSMPWKKSGKFIDKDGYVRVTAGYRDHPRRTTGGVYEHILVMEKHLGRHLTPDEEVHHKDRIRHHNWIDNLELLSGIEHHAKHGREGGFRNMQGGRGGKGGLVEFVPVVDEVASVEPAGETDVYDIVCADPHRNFVANGIIVHNCGKTPETIVAAEARLSMAAIPSPKTPVVLVVCPALAKRHWQAELKKWVGADSVVLDSLRPDPNELTERYVICNYDILYGGQKRDAAGVVHDVAHLPGWAQTLAGRFLITIFDEAHMLRGKGSRRTKAAKLVCKGTPVVWALTGTPMPNHVRDLYSLVDVISDGIFGYSYWTWAKTYAGAVQGAYGWTDKGASQLEELQARLSYFALGRTAAQVQLQLPEKRREVVKIDVEVSAPTVHEGLQALDRKQAVMSGLRATARAKRPAVVNAAVEALEANQKVIVFVYMREQADAVAKDVRKRVDCTVFCVHGDLSPDGRYAQAQQFREASAPTCFVATIDSMGVALSLVGANLMIFGDLVPEPWKMLQAEKRGHRFDSVVRLLVRYFIATGTVDEGIAEAVIAKIPIIEQTLGAQEDSTEMVKMLGGRSDEEIVSALFAKLTSWSATNG